MVGGELGGNRRIIKYGSGAILISAWMVFIIGSSMHLISQEGMQR